LARWYATLVPMTPPPMMTAEARDGREGFMCLAYSIQIRIVYRT
jgi:hypothetical protein